MARVPVLDRATIVAVSLQLADAEGLDRLSMRRLSAELGVTPMAIYHHVSGKEQLLDMVAEESLRMLPALDVDADPRAALLDWFFAFYELLVAHPGLAQTVAGRRLEGPAAAEIAERILLVARRAGLGEEVAVDLLVGLFSFALGGSLYRISRRAAGARRGERRRLPPLDESASPAARRLRGRLAGATFGDQQFQEGLHRLVDGYLST